MAGANGFVVWAETIKQTPAEHTQPVGLLPAKIPVWVVAGASKWAISLAV